MHLSRTFLQRGCLAAAFVLAANLQRAADAFEGRVEMKISSAARDEAHVINYALKEGKLRFDFPKGRPDREAGAGGMIVDYAKGEMYILMEMPDRESGATRKMYMRRPLPQPGEAPADAGRVVEPPVSEPVVTGRTEVIAGYKAAEYTVTGKDGEVHELWLAKGIGHFMFPAAQNPMGRGRRANASPVWEKLVRQGGFFPLRVVTRAANGAEKTRLEVTKIEQTALPDALFTTEGYSEFQIPGFEGGLPAGLNPFKR